VSAAPGRPLPQVTVENEFFWTSGADGKLRLQECKSCESLIHPPAPVCRYCRSLDVGVRAVSGRATIAGFTVNERFSLPGLEAPYVIAQVAITEDPRVRLTTNIVECEAGQLELGQQVEVVFEHVEDVWFPLFRPVPDAQPGPLPEDEIAPERFGEYIRPMLTTEKFEDKVALTGIGMSLIAAMLAVAGGLARHVLCFRTLWEATNSELMKQGKITPPNASGGRMSGWQMPFGATSAAHTLAMNAQRHFHRYGTTKETLGWIALNQRANAELNPTAIYRTPMTMDDYLNARPITTPFGLYDCDVPCDGAVAVIVSAVDAARDLAKPPVLVEAVGTQIVERLDWDQSTLTHEPQVLGQAAHVWTRTSLRPADVDVAELYDGFSFNCLSWIEALGFCGIGEAKDFLDGGKNIARDGQLPLNTHGGQLSHGRTHGMGLLHEAITQLRGEAGDRQVTDARIGVVSSGGLTPSGVLLLRAAQ
jgi:acetyl-CoA acetyltransferase/uncharacterized OB-fold protein